MKIGIASDHRGYKLKEFLKNHLDYEMIDYGTTSEVLITLTLGYH